MFEGTSCINDPIIISPDLAFRAEATTGEGSIWHPDRNTLFWVDIEGKTLYEYIPDLQNCRSWQFDRMVSTVVPETDSTVVVALQNEIIRVNLTDGNTTSIAPIPDNNGKIRCNDGKCDPSGRLWIGTMGFGAPKGAASLYCVWADGTVETKLTKVTISNGIVWSANKKYMYYNDTPTRKIIRFRYDDSSGDILYDGVAVNIPPQSRTITGRFVATMGNATRPDAYGSAPWDLAHLKGLPAFIVYGQTEPSKQS